MNLICGVYQILSELQGRPWLHWKPTQPDRFEIEIPHPNEGQAQSGWHQPIRVLNSTMIDSPK